jgi:predicted Holliday junction resolvase-like endonuclease
MDRYQKAADEVEKQRASLEERSAALQRAAKDKAEREVLPQLLRRALPAFYDLGIDPRDVRTVSHPLDFVLFRGMNSPSGVEEVALLSFGPPNPYGPSIRTAIQSHNVVWRTIRVGDDGSVSPDD